MRAIGRRSSAIGTVRRSTFSRGTNRTVVGGEVAHFPYGGEGQVGVSRPAVWRWQQRFAEAGVEGLLRDKTRKPGKAPLSAETVAKVLALPCAEPPGEATHWTGRAVARVVWRLLARGAAHLAGQPPATAPHPHLQEVHRSGLRREGRGHRRPLHGPAGARRRRCRSTKKAKSRRSIAPSPACR